MNDDAEQIADAENAAKIEVSHLKFNPAGRVREKLAALETAEPSV